LQHDSLEEQQPKKCDKAAQQKLLLARNAASTVFRQIHWRALSLLQYQYHSTLGMIFALQRQIIGIAPPQPLYFLLFSSSWPQRGHLRILRERGSGCERRQLYFISFPRTPYAYTFVQDHFLGASMDDEK
jgi:hypothetical protein